jgi:hypothetical protein
VALGWIVLGMFLLVLLKPGGYQRLVKGKRSAAMEALDV